MMNKETAKRKILFLSLFSWYLKSCHSYSPKPKFWTFRGHPISYEIAKKEKIPDGDDASILPREDPILLLNGFGVGSFHQHRLMEQLVSQSPQDSLDMGKNDSTRLIYGVDYLGQGKSWPTACNDGDAECEKGLIYSADMWVDQIISFIEEVAIPDNQRNNGMEANQVKVHIVGNSVGGYLSVFVALKRPDLVSSITLLNATPVWGLNLPGWSGHLPAPFIPKKVGRYLFDRIRDFNTIEKYLEAAYSDSAAFGEDLMMSIRSCTEGLGGHAAFASILWSPPATVDHVKEPDFNSKLARLECDVLLVFGRDDPWCKPSFAKKMLTSLYKRGNSVQRYVELSNAGHCPNHEAPQAVARILNRWVSSKKEHRNQTLLVDTNERNGLDIMEEVVHEPWGRIGFREVFKDEAEKLSLIDELVIKMVG